MSVWGLIALVFTTALCATLRRPAHPAPSQKGFCALCNRTFLACTGKYTQTVEKTLKRKRLASAVVLGLFALAAFLFPKLPTAFMPDEDQGNMFVLVQLPPNASSERTQAVLDEVTRYINADESDVVTNILTVNGFSFAGRGQNVGMAFVRLKAFEERTGDDTGVFSLADRCAARFSQIHDARVMPIIPPAIPELGNATGFDFFVIDRGGQGHEALMEARDQFLSAADQDSPLAMDRPNGLNDEPQYKIILDDGKPRSYPVKIRDVNNTRSVAGGLY